ncbi:MAG: hypothetical protein ACE5H2_01135 [Terriglobia bacterium]
MDCEHLRHLLGGVLEGAAEPEALWHLKACGRCRLLVEELSAVSRTATRLPIYEPRPGLWWRIRGVAEAEGLLAPSGVSLLGRRLGLFQPFPLTPAFSAAMIVLLVAAAVLVGYPGLDVGPAHKEPLNDVEIARSELALAPDSGKRYARYLEHIEESLWEEMAPADTQLTRVAKTNLETLDGFISECQQRLTNYPEDEFARDELNRLYQEKTTLLQAMLDPDWQTSLR